MSRYLIDLTFSYPLRIITAVRQKADKQVSSNNLFVVGRNTVRFAVGVGNAYKVYITLSTRE